MDKRISPRFGPLVLKAHLEIYGEPYEGYVINLSREGAFVALEEPPAVEAEVAVRTLLPFKLGEFEGEARVVWRSEAASVSQDDASCIAGVGLRFASVPDGSNDRLHRYLARFEELASRLDELPALEDADSSLSMAGK